MDASASGQLSAFPVPVHFVFSGSRRAWPELFDGDALPDPDRIPQRFLTIRDCWVAQTYLRLRRAGLAATISEKAVEDSINVISYNDLAIRDLNAELYVIGVQADVARPEICERRVVQNELGKRTGHDHFIPHWPQPGLIPRDPARGHRLETLSFKGWKENLYSPFRGPQFTDALRSRGLALEIDEMSQGAKSAPRWHDHRSTDLILAVRDCTEADFSVKPASKLVNAWRAGCPALLGPEPAFRALRRGPLDYFEIRTPEDALAVLSKLQAAPALFEAMVKNGRERAVEFTPERIAAHWHALLSGPAADDFLRTFHRQRWLRKLARWPRFGLRAWAHKRNMRRFQRARVHGFWPVSNRTT